VRATLRAVPGIPTEVDDRVTLVWKAATWLQLGKVDPALGLLETLAGLPIDEWSAAVLRGTRRLRAADAQLGRAADLARAGERESASEHWERAAASWAEARGGISLRLTVRSGTMVLVLPDPWLHVLDAFQEHLDRSRRFYAGEERPGEAAPVMVQSRRPGA
jgi:hypothetical protein